jgi:hypothetical protein
MRTMTGLGVWLTAIVWFAPSDAWAQHSQTRQGFWIGLGLGFGEAWATCTACGTASEGGPTGSVKLGGTLRANTLIGGVVHAWIKSSNGATEIVGDITGSIFYYPRSMSGFFVTGGVGLSYYNLSGFGATNSMGWGLRAGGGYDIRVGTMTSLTPVADVTYGGGLSPGGKTGWKQTVIDLGLGITFH